jgi:AcrR family transcriptional regulator
MDDITATAPAKSLRADARRNREKVLAAARQTFATEGLDAQVEVIARRAGVGVGTVYRHFPTKEALLEALWEARTKRTVEISRAALQNPDPWGGLVEMFEQGTAMLVEDRGWCEFAALPMPALTAETAPRELLEATGELIGRAKAAGCLREDFDFDSIRNVFAAVATVVTASGGEAGYGLLRVILEGLRAQASGT